jgi:hypothetical protein
MFSIFACECLLASEMLQLAAGSAVIVVCVGTAYPPHDVMHCQFILFTFAQLVDFTHFSTLEVQPQLSCHAHIVADVN